MLVHVADIVLQQTCIEYYRSASTAPVCLQTLQLIQLTVETTLVINDAERNPLCWWQAILCTFDEHRIDVGCACVCAGVLVITLML